MNEASRKAKAREMFLEEWKGWWTLPMAANFRKMLEAQAAEATEEWASLLNQARPDPVDLQRAHDEVSAALGLLNTLKEMDGDSCWNWLHGPAEDVGAEPGD